MITEREPGGAGGGIGGGGGRGGREDAPEVQPRSAFAGAMVVNVKHIFSSQWLQLLQVGAVLQWAQQSAAVGAENVPRWCAGFDKHVSFSQAPGTHCREIVAGGAGASAASSSNTIRRSSHAARCAARAQSGQSTPTQRPLCP